MPVIDPESTDEKIISNTIRDMLKDKKMIQPLEISRLLFCVQKLPFSTNMIFDKIEGRWIVTNQTTQDIIASKQRTIFSGPNFIVVDITLERALARAIHYHYHTKMRE